MNRTTIGILLVVICAFLEGLGQVFLKKSVLTKVRWFMWISAGVIVLALQALIYTEALKLLDVSVAFTILSLNLIAITVLWVLLSQIKRVAGAVWTPPPLVDDMDTRH